MPTFHWSEPVDNRISLLDAEGREIGVLNLLTGEWVRS